MTMRGQGEDVFFFEQRKWGALECSEVLDMLEGIKYLNLSSHER